MPDTQPQASGRVDNSIASSSILPPCTTTYRHIQVLTLVTDPKSGGIMGPDRRVTIGRDAVCGTPPCFWVRSCPGYPPGRTQGLRQLTTRPAAQAQHALANRTPVHGNKYLAGTISSDGIRPTVCQVPRRRWTDPAPSCFPGSGSPGRTWRWLVVERPPARSRCSSLCPSAWTGGRARLSPTSTRPPKILRAPSRSTCGKTLWHRPACHSYDRDSGTARALTMTSPP